MTRTYTIETLPSLAKKWDIIDPYTTGYSDLLKKALEELQEKRKLKNYLDLQTVSFLPLYKDQLETLEKKQGDTPHSFVINLDSCKGKSVDKVRKDKIKNQLLLNSVQIARLLTLYPDVLTHHEDTWIDCAADTYTGCGWAGSPYFHFYDVELDFDARFSGNFHGRFGSCLAFLGEDLDSGTMDVLNTLTLELTINGIEYVQKKQ